MSSNPLMGSSRLPPSNGLQNLPRSSNGRSSSSTTHSSPSITLERVMKEHHSSNSSQSVENVYLTITFVLISICIKKNYNIMVFFLKERMRNDDGQTPAQRQAAAKLALRKQLEKTLLQVSNLILDR